jgi:CBS domain-containing protein
MKRTVRQILDKKGSQVWAILPDTSGYEALELMADKNIGALVVVSSEKVLGIFSERDYARKVILKGKSSNPLTLSAQKFNYAFYDPDQISEYFYRLVQGFRRI